MIPIETSFLQLSREKRTNETCGQELNMDMEFIGERVLKA